MLAVARLLLELELEHEQRRLPLPLPLMQLLLRLLLHCRIMIGSLSNAAMGTNGISK
jgi:hypothetical protein